ncbi:hypothetical protein RO3G_15343 [Rhizopus delemar RA 99-880]|uniref:Uncharacterized protein n=1 Tax=Rhizopus delemar (strain RA 99-880 / ATCC MYA-4621 / FGSC 9543 / NRRL 43880) TaxID=246409 RepID=I1CQA2_RHIO9|nr:hypothetical protein RO3G_15343 [Rhizopus delemar RA 99-880]|eukprot:EIE90632.1 hypothetical protein RO3G_15343 [Rhizopus delemar RA 99-880]
MKSTELIWVLLTTRRSFLSSQSRNKAETYPNLLRAGKVVKENPFGVLKSSPNYVLGGFIPFFGFQRPAPQFASLSSPSSPDGTPIEKLYIK